MPPAAPDKIVTFAYGSNMLTKRLTDRCPSARALGMAELRGYELRWHKRSDDGSGKCDVVKSSDEGSVVNGVLFSVARTEKGDLDRAEGRGRGYDEMEVDVSFNGAACKAQLYYATNHDPKLKPYTWYKALVVAGAKEHGLPPDYVRDLEDTPAIEDPDRKRHATNMKLLKGN